MKLKPILRRMLGMCPLSWSIFIRSIQLSCVLLLGAVLGALLALLLPLAGATRMREPFAWLMWIPAAVILLILLYQFLAANGTGQDLPVLRLLATGDTRIITAEAAFAAYMLAFSIRTGKGI